MRKYEVGEKKEELDGEEGREGDASVTSGVVGGRRRREEEEEELVQTTTHHMANCATLNNDNDRMGDAGAREIL